MMEQPTPSVEKLPPLLALPLPLKQQICTFLDEPHNLCSLSTTHPLYSASVHTSWVFFRPKDQEVSAMDC